jgi:glycolate oxidase
MACSPEIIHELTRLLGPDSVLTAAEDLLVYAFDGTAALTQQPGCVVFARDTADIQAVLRLAQRTQTPVVTRGSGTGLSGGSLPVPGCIVLCTVRMNRILEVDPANLTLLTEPGATTLQIAEAAAAVGLFYPPDPGSMKISTIGGNVAENSGGLRGLKYGITRNYVMGLEVVLPDGEILFTGNKCVKDVAGYSLKDLFIGSEGTLGIITKIHLKLIPKPLHDLLLLLPFENMEDACSAVSDIFKAGITPSALEFMERNAIEWSAQYLGESLSIPSNIQAHLLIELDGRHLEVLYQDAENVAAVCEKYPTGEILMADASHQKEQLWKIRRNVAHAVKANSVYKEEDTVVPRFQMPLLLKTVKEIGKKYGFESVCYGHVGDGNLHVNIIRGKLSDEAWQTTVVKGISELFQAVKEMGGTISGEHGIGYVQKNYLSIVFSETELNLMRSIKQQFDPKGILNPGKIFPDS